MRYITANQIFSGQSYLPANTVIVLNDKNIVIDLIDKKQLDIGQIEHYDGIVSPGFINTHCHLELSHLKNTISQKTGIVNFALDVIKNRHNTNNELQLEAIDNADKQMYEQGIVAVGDISNTTMSLSKKKVSAIYYHTFVEVIGLNPEKADPIFEHGLELTRQFKESHLPNSLVAHAPYSVSKELLEKITTSCSQEKKPTSIHNQESVSENNFFISKSGDILKLYSDLNISIDFFNSTCKTSLQSILNVLNTDNNTLLVHNTFTNAQDIEIANQIHKQLFWCLCPNANLYIENTLPNIELLLEMKCNLTLGTDSLASNANLSIIDEINTIKKYYPAIAIETLLQMATYNGAKFLGIENTFGSIKINNACGLNLITENRGRFEVKKIS
jgi:cytosine/adenosine deaminase-related metal-dependent hydrolase